MYLFDGTVFENIAYARRDATLEQVVAAATQANAHEFIEQLEDGYEAIIANAGSNCRGGSDSVYRLPAHFWPIPKS